MAKIVQCLQAYKNKLSECNGCKESEPHKQSLTCNIKCCDAPGKFVRCVPIEELPIK